MNAAATNWESQEYGIDWTSRESLERACGKSLPQIPAKIKYLPELTKHQFCAFHNVGNGATFHRRERIKILWPEFQFHRWVDRMLEATSTHRWVTVIGPASSGKSGCAAIFALEFWLQAPDRTAVIVCSTTMKMLRKRIWSEIVHFHQQLPRNIGPVGELMDSITTIRWRQGDDKHAIFGIAVEEGNVEEVINNLLGIKAKRVYLIIDEGQGIREAILRATFNMSKNPRFDFLMIGNPESMQTPLLRESEPIDGWDSVVRAETPSWETLGGSAPGNGICLFFDGRKSPANDSPEERKRLPFLINDEHIANHLKSVRGNLNDPTYWSQCIGWPPPMGLESTLLDDAILTTFHCKDKTVWTEGYIRCAAFDPARTGGDKRILQFGKRGRTSGTEFDRDSRTWSTSVGKTSWIIECDEWLEVPINSESSRPLDYQMVDFVKVECIKRGVPPEEFSVFATGAGGPLLSIFRAEWSPLVNGIEEGGSPSERILDDTGKIAKDAYDTRASELLFNVREFATSNGLRGLSNEASFELCSRRTFYRSGKWCAEPKTGSKGRTDEKGRPVKGYKQRLGHSPDHGDTVAALVCHCMEKGAAPNLVVAPIPQSTDPMQNNYDEWDEKNYLKSYSYSMI